MGAGCALAFPPRARAATQKALFIIARSLNANVLCYDARLDARGALDRDHPITADWIMHEAGGRREELTWFERQFAYGFSVTAPVEPRRLRMRLDAFPSRELLVGIDAAGQPHAYTTIAAQSAVLSRIFVQLEPGGGLPRVRHVELSGTAVRSGQVLRERVRP
ncbi:MAG TPA: DUF4833 domain-containing protein [Polyangiaceae bacterium]|nr:DUF4833 domain-containing protein [Polyangiaceae bacterium]